MNFSVLGLSKINFQIYGKSSIQFICVMHKLHRAQMHQTSKYSNQSDWKNASETRDPSFGLTQFTTYERFSLFWSHYRNAITRIKVVACRIQLLKTIPHFWLNRKQCAYVRFCKLDSWSNNDVDNDIFNFSLDRPRPVITRFRKG